MAATYILRCRDNRFYVGSTNNLQHRLIDHNRGKCKFTKSRLPIELVYQEEFPSLSKARKRELEIKKRKSRKYIEDLVKSNTTAPSSNGSGH